MDQDAAPVGDIGLAEACQGEGCPVGDRGRLLEAQVGRLVRSRHRLSHADELGVGAGALDPENLVARLELGDSAGR